VAVHVQPCHQTETTVVLAVLLVDPAKSVQVVYVLSAVLLVRQHLMENASQYVLLVHVVPVLLMQLV
jgi:hypothetical protein